VHRADLADVAAAELLEDPLSLHQQGPEPVRLLGLVPPVDVVVGEGDGTLDLDGHGPDAGRDTERLQGGHHLGVELRHRSRLQRDRTPGAVGGRDVQAVLVQVERHLERGPVRARHQ
jgi:hypothetical protein